jgi:CelD/BcsL family acetyltransferase involved in cellulose biosynthesis
MPQLSIVNPLEVPDWDAQVLEFPEATVFHSAAWARVLVESYGFKPQYCVKYDGKRIAAVLPLMQVRDLLGRKKAVCLPFSDFCAPLYSDPADFRELFDHAQDLARARKWRSISIRGHGAFPPETLVATTHFRHVLALNGDSDVLLRGFRDTTRRNVKKAAKQGVTVDFGSTSESLDQFYRLNCQTRRRHGLPPQPLFFFEKLFLMMIRPGSGHIVVARCGEKTIAAAVFLIFGATVYFKYGASDEENRSVMSNFAIFWEAIKYYSAAGYAVLDFGRTEEQHTGLLQFKTGWGTRQVTVDSYEYDVARSAFVKSHLPTEGLHNTIFSHAPTFTQKLFSSLFYKYAS